MNLATEVLKGLAGIQVERAESSNDKGSSPRAGVVAALLVGDAHPPTAWQEIKVGAER